MCLTLPGKWPISCHFEFRFKLFRKTEHCKALCQKSKIWSILTRSFASVGRVNPAVRTHHFSFVGSARTGCPELLFSAAKWLRWSLVRMIRDLSHKLGYPFPRRKGRGARATTRTRQRHLHHRMAFVDCNWSILIWDSRALENLS
jgi:hypothetical protein